MEYLDKAGLTHLWTQIVNKINSSTSGSSGGSSSIKELTGTNISLNSSDGIAEGGTIYHLSGLSGSTSSGITLRYSYYAWTVYAPALAYLSYKSGSHMLTVFYTDYYKQTPVVLNADITSGESSVYNLGNTPASTSTIKWLGSTIGTGTAGGVYGGWKDLDPSTFVGDFGRVKSVVIEVSGNMSSGPSKFEIPIDYIESICNHQFMNAVRCGAYSHDSSNQFIKPTSASNQRTFSGFEMSMYDPIFLDATDATFQGIAIPYNTHGYDSNDTTGKLTIIFRDLGTGISGSYTARPGNITGAFTHKIQFAISSSANKSHTIKVGLLVEGLPYYEANQY